MKNSYTEHLIEVAAELALRDFKRVELSTYNIRRKEFYSKYEKLARKNYIKIFWRKLNELALHAYRGQSSEALTLDSIRYCFMFRQSAAIKVADLNAWLQVTLSNSSFLLANSKGSVYITATDMGSYPVNMPAESLFDMIVAFNAYLDTDVDSLVKDAYTSCIAQIKADEVLTTTAKNMVGDMMKGKKLDLSMRQHKGRMYCEVKDLNLWGKEVTFRTSLETLRNDMLVNCSKARVGVNVRKDNEQMLTAAAKKKPVYGIVGNASFLKDVDICPLTRNDKTLDSYLRFDGNIIDIFDLKSRRSKYSYLFENIYRESLRTYPLHSPKLLYMLCFASVSKKYPLVINIEGRPVKFTEVDFDHAPIVWDDEYDDQSYDNIHVRLISPDENIFLLLDSGFTEYLSFGKFNGINVRAFKKHYGKMAPSLRKLGLELQDASLQAAEGPTKVYARGLARMLSHTVGFSKRYSGWDGMHMVYMGSILYRFPDHIDGGKLDSYVNAHKTWCKGLNSLPGVPSNFKVIETPFIYQDVFTGQNANVLPERVKEFYGFGKL